MHGYCFTSFRRFLACGVVATMFLTAKAWAIAITVGGVAIADGGAMDLDGAVNGSIKFNSAAAGAAGFAVPQGYLVSGTTAPIQRAGGFYWVTLTDFACVRPAMGAAGGAMPISLSHTFVAVAAAPNIIRWFGQHDNPNPAGLVGATSTLSAKSNNVVIPGGVAGLITIGPAKNVNVAPFAIQAGPTPAAAGNVTITADLTIDLGAGDAARYPNSVDIGNVDLQGVSLPAARPWMLSVLALGAAILGLAALRRRALA